MATNLELKLDIAEPHFFRTKKNIGNSKVKLCKSVPSRSFTQTKSGKCPQRRNSTSKHVEVTGLSESNAAKLSFPVEKRRTWTLRDRIKMQEEQDTVNNISVNLAHLNRSSIKPFSLHQDKLKERFIKNVSKDLNFGTDVITSLASPGSLSYDPNMNTAYLFDAVGICSSTLHAPKFTGPKRPQVEENKHVPCNMSGVMKTKVTNVNQVDDEGHLPLLVPAAKESSQFSLSSAPSFHYKDLEFQFNDKPCEDMNWDTYIVSKLSPNTANWVVKKHTEADDLRERLDGYLEKQYGPCEDTASKIELVKETISTDSVAVHAAKNNSPHTQWKKKELVLLEKAFAMNDEVHSGSPKHWREESLHSVQRINNKDIEVKDVYQISNVLTTDVTGNKCTPTAKQGDLALGGSGGNPATTDRLSPRMLLLEQEKC
ncbi:PREDICTED: uncharacterized protein LOC106809952 [Priapulus caudatus]|uniref:Uncharacterized protein LOC106809952 n=1 Tax=Priapulus caudatus TaxID=37621 RepID=A0ABM1E909_PRICU|nr:PREDICTED: uncharacterized protein LOC106809952 [Priapulus caudatus]